MPIELTIKEIIGYGSAAFTAGGLWREVWLMRKTVGTHAKKLSNDRDVLIKLATEHNKNHNSCIDVPNVNGKSG